MPLERVELAREVLERRRRVELVGVLGGEPEGLPLALAANEDRDALADRLAEAVSSVSIDVLRGEELAGRDFDDPRYAVSRTDEWQRARVAELVSALASRGIPTWPGELPPELLGIEPARLTKVPRA